MPPSAEQVSSSGSNEATHQGYAPAGQPGEEAHSERGTTGGTTHTPPSLLGSVTATPKALPDELSLLQVALPSVARHLIRDKTVAKWGILRRRVVRELREKWEQACAGAGTPGFAIDVDMFVEELNKWMPEFRSVPYEETFSGILQLLRDALTGESYLRMHKEGLHEVLLDVLSRPDLTGESALAFSVYNDVHTTLLEANLLG